MELNSSTMSDTETDKIFSHLEDRLGSRYLKRRMDIQKRYLLRRYPLSSRMNRKKIEPHYICLRYLLMLSGLYNRARSNSVLYEIDDRITSFKNLPSGFHGFKILHLSDIHVEGIIDNGKKLTEIISGLEYDLCLMTGDYRFLTYTDYRPSMKLMEGIIASAQCRYGVMGILGNHDCIDMVPDLESFGMRILINESVKLENSSDRIWIAGVDEASLKCADIPKSLEDVQPEGFTVFLAHSPDLLKQAEAGGVCFYLCGHTHGGQICLPGRIPVITKTRRARKYSRDSWEYKGMKGYTSAGTGASGLPVRLNCPPRITIHTLVKS